MSWQSMIGVFLNLCVVRGFQSSTLVAYRRSLEQFQKWLLANRDGRRPTEVLTQDVVDYIEYLRRDKNAAHATVNAQAVTLKAFYRALVAKEIITPRQNPTLLLERLKPPKRKVPDVLSSEEVERLIDGPRKDTVLGLRDRAILAVLWGCGIRASECAGVKEEDVDLDSRTIRVLGKGGNERVVPLNEVVVVALSQYRAARGESAATRPFFQTRGRRGATRGVVYERVRRFARRVGLHKRVTPHVLRHTFATHLLRQGTKLIVIKELLGHRLITSTQVYLHLTGEDLRSAINQHPIGKLAKSLSDVLPIGKLRMQWPHGTRFAFNID